MRLWKLLRRLLGRRETNEAALPSSQLALARLKALYEHDPEPFQMPDLHACEQSLAHEQASRQKSGVAGEIDPPLPNDLEPNSAHEYAVPSSVQYISAPTVKAPAILASAAVFPAASKKRGVLFNASDAAIRQVIAMIAMRHGLSLTFDLPSGERVHFGCDANDGDIQLIWHEGDYRVRSHAGLFDMPADGESLYHALHVVRSGLPGDYLLGPTVLGITQLYVPPRRQAAEKVRSAIGSLRHEALRLSNH